MPKIQPINHIHLSEIKKVITKSYESTNATPPYELGTVAAGIGGVIISTFLQDFNKTVDEENYFQLKINGICLANSTK